MSAITIMNPILWADVPDPSVIRTGEVFYMVSTSMHSMPGCPIMKSVNLVDWEVVRYVFDTIEDNDSHNLIDGRGIYGQGSWATSLRYHEGLFYVCFSCNDTKRFYVYRTTDIEKGPWERSVIEGLYHDPSLLFDDGRVYVFYGNGEIRVRELTSDVITFKDGGIDRLLLETAKDGIGLRCEGCHAYKRNGYYYLFFIEWPKTGNGRRRQLVYRSRELLGPYEHKVVLDDDMGFGNNGVAQGGIIETPFGEWFAVLFQDHGAVGRIPIVVPVYWDNDWPVFGIGGSVPQSFEAKLPASPARSLVACDEFDYAQNKLILNWQWNHNPDNRLWSATARPGWLRLHTGRLAESVLQARNTLTQRTEGPACEGTTLLDSSGMRPGDRAGLVALQNGFGSVGIRVDKRGQRSVCMCVNNGDDGEEVLESIAFDNRTIFLKIVFDFEQGDIARFYYSNDGVQWTEIGQPLHMKYTLDHFMGYRIGLYHYATRNEGGFTDFDFFRYRRNADLHAGETSVKWEVVNDR
ncbi:glycoside hydrolase family 43 protein [Cohnella herbarum]|uniref:Glycosyl hydrolase 43 family protein n=1 Tax=Cohnella herbarum TaxID=2728023 RepID=A0A7Z2VIW4_9BACL|nr:glycoside hydrolase 43 family protein [Cohnella herbarum]QJD84028.1 glycosyl hydrolase 43 family protein [Cohnella herbarum]